MTQDHIKQIAENADQLISIIQTIKEKSNPITAVRAGKQRPLTSVTGGNINEPCIEDENEEDCTYEVIDTERLNREKEKNDGEGTWW